MIQPRLVLGSLPAIEAALAGEIRAWKARDPLDLPLILVGNAPIRVYLRRRLAHEAGGHVGLRLVTPGELARMLGEPAALAAGRAPLPRGGERILVEEVALGADGYFAPVAGAPGFVQSLQRLFRELRQAGVDAAALWDGARRTAVNAEKATALGDLYAAYETRRLPFYTPDDCVALADPSRFDAPALLVYGVVDPPATLRRLLERLAARLPVTVYLAVTPTEADRAHQSSVTWLEGLAARRETLPDPAAAGETALAHLQTRLFNHLTRPASDDGTVRLVSAPDPAREVREAARACLAWAAAGIPFHEMAVVYRNPDPYRELLDEAFHDAGIPIYLRDGRPLIGHPLGRSLLVLLDLAGSNLRRSAVMEFLTATTLPAATAERYGPLEPAAWDAVSREAGIVEGRQQWLKRLEYLAYVKRRDAVGDDGEPDARLRAKLEEIERLHGFIDDFADRLEARPARGTWEAHLAYLGSLARDYLAGAEPVLAELDTLAAFLPLVPEIPFRRFQHAARIALQEMTIEQVLGPPSGRFGREGVNVLDVHSLGHLRFRAVVVLGLVERAFPPPPRQDALLLDRERSRLNAAAGWSLPLRALGPDPEPLQFALAVQAATDRLQLSFARGEAGSRRGHLPSHFFRAAAEALSGQRVPVDAVDALPASQYTRVPAGRFGAARPEEALTGLEYDRTLLAVSPAVGAACLAARAPAFARARQVWSARWRSPALTPYDGVLSPGALGVVARRAGLARAIAPTRLETYATCPFRFFLHYLLKLEPVEEPELLERIEALERGSLIHAVLDRFMRERGQGDPPRLEHRAEHLARLRAIASEECAERERRGVVGYPLLWEIDRKAILEDLVTWYDREVADGADHGLRPGAFELRFGPRWQPDADGDPHFSTDEPLLIEAGGVTLRFQGRIDRVDWSPGRTAFRVIDYKTGGKSPQHRDDRLSGGRALQLPIYLLAAARALGTDWRRGSAEYFYVSRKGEFKRMRFEGAALDARWDEFVDLLRGLAESVGAGDFHPVPGADGSHCQWCDYKAVCDARIVRLAERKAGAEAASRFTRLMEVE